MPRITVDAAHGSWHNDVCDGQQVWSYGGGVQSAAIAVLIATKRLPTPDLAVIADTGREADTTWTYLADHVRPLLYGLVEVHVAPHALSTVDLYAKNGDLLIPAFTNSGGALRTLCSNEWKKRVVRRWLRARGVHHATIWLGISRDEGGRMKESDVGWIIHRYPLISEVPMNRAECVQVIMGAGLPVPPRSSCWMCPYRSDAEWRMLRKDSPDGWDRAVALDAAIRERDPGVFLHRRMAPLPKAVKDDTQADLFDACESGYCWT